MAYNDMMMQLCVAGAVAGVSYILLQKRKTYPGIVPHGPKPLPIFGNAITILRNHYRNLDYFQELAEEWGEVFNVYLLNLTITTISSPENLEHILKTNFANYIKGPEWKDRFQELLGDGIFTADGASWKAQRKIASHMFSRSCLRDSMTPKFVNRAQQFCDLLDKAANSGKSIEIQAYYSKYTMDSISEIAFGYNVNSLASSQVAFASAFNRVVRVCEYRFTNPAWRICKWLLPSEYEFRKDMKTINEFAHQVIERKRNASQKDNSQFKDILDRLLEARDVNGKPLDDKYLRDSVMSFLLAGRDTTSNALSWTTYMLAKHPEVQEKVLIEVKNVLAKTALGFDAVNEMPYLHAVINETLRLYPSVPIDVKYAAEADVLPTGHQIKPGQMISYVPWVVNRNPKIWKDPLKFDPERWFKTNPSSFEFPTFNAGPRLCLGNAMALVQVKVLLAKILQTFKIKLEPKQEVEYMSALTLPMKNGLHIKLEKRKPEPIVLSG